MSPKCNAMERPHNWTDVSRRVLDLLVAAITAPVAGALATGATITLLANRQRDWLAREPRIGQDHLPFDLLRFSKPKMPQRLASWVDWLNHIGAYDTPVLWNLLRGDIGWVGPEALAPAEAEKILDAHPRFQTRPGLTDTYRLRHRMNLVDQDRDLLERVDQAKRSVRHDAAVLLKSLPAWFLGSASPVRGDSFTLLDVDLANLTIHEAISRLDALAREGGRHVAFANPHCFNVAARDPGYREVLGRADLVLPDGVGIQLACRMIGAELRENLNGTDLLPHLCRHAARCGQSIFLVGAAPGVAETMRDRLVETYAGLRIVGAKHGYFQPATEDEREVIEAVRQARPDYLLVARGVPTQERWIDEHLQELGAGVALGVGGLFDFVAGRIPRAPVWVREVGLEWLWRLGQEPRRMCRRYLVGNPEFLVRVWHWYLGLSRTTLVNRFSSIDHPARRMVLDAEFHSRRWMWWAATEGALRLKRCVDIAGSGIGLLLLTPLFTATAAAIKLEDSAGSVFYTQQRVGRHGRLFPMYKFRSMVSNADEIKRQLMDQNESADGVIFKMKNDPRITRTGRFIRKYSIDELPQLYNVLIGDMSIVGPRPPIPPEVAQYRVADRYRLEVVPGLTCVWQVSGRSDIPFDEQVILDRTYIRRQGFWHDLKLIAKTVPVVLTGSGAY